jgi:outer membrane immunogenic protein
MKKIAAFALIAAAGAAPALAGGPVIVADEAVVAAPAPQRVMNTGGEWGGFYGGAQLGFGNVGVTDLLGEDGDGLLGGLHAGYRMDFGTFVAGAEVAYDFANINVGELEVESVESMARLGLTGGIDLGQTLVYGTLGKARVNVEGSGIDETGNYYGIGADYALNTNMTVGGQLLRHEFDGVTDGSLDTTTLQAKVSFKF